jgi:hypothetical protein
MRESFFLSEADKCRSQAREYAGRPESHFLLRVADSFEKLATYQPAPEVRPHVQRASV